MSAPTHAPAWDTTKRHLVPAMVLGSTLEWYDMFLYAQASALVFGTLFFTGASPLAGTVAAFATFGVGYAARPLGALLFGHIGDRYGRRVVLVTTLVVMGTATTLIGLLPTYATAGIAAPIMLVALRLCQGIAAGAELAGSVVMLVEVAPLERRGFWSSIPAIGVYCGVVLASLVGTLAYSLPAEQLLDWGWRVPFLVSIALVVTGLWVRLRIGESPAFPGTAAHTGAPPVAAMVRHSPRRLLLAIVLVAPIAAASAIVLVYSLAYSASVGTPRAVPLLGSLLGAALAIITAPLAGHLGDRFGRRPVYMVLCLATAAWAFPFFALLSTAQTWAVIVAHLVVAPATWAITGAQAAYIAELFPARYRLSGVALSKEICTALTAPLPVICVGLAAALGGAPWLVAGVLAACGVAGFAALLALPETRPRTPPPVERPDPRGTTMAEDSALPVSRVIAALSANRADDDVFAADCVSWHNFDETESPTVPDGFATLRAVLDAVPDYRFSDVVAHDAGDGVSVAQFVAIGTLPDGSALRAPGVLVAHSRDGKVVRLEEYLDTGQLSGVLALLAAQV